jgi:peptidoglycan-N-acetylglucosamine deacetylase
VKAAEPPKSPVATIPSTGTVAPAKTTSIAAAEVSPVKTVSGAGQSASSSPAAEAPSANDDTLEAAHPTQPKKSISEKIKETWKFWFGD